MFSHFKTKKIILPNIHNVYLSVEDKGAKLEQRQGNTWAKNRTVRKPYLWEPHQTRKLAKDEWCVYDSSLRSYIKPKKLFCRMLEYLYYFLNLNLDDE